VVGFAASRDARAMDFADDCLKCDAELVLQVYLLILLLRMLTLLPGAAGCRTLYSLYYYAYLLYHYAHHFTTTHTHLTTTHTT
jgi:hypothetical protein